MYAMNRPIDNCVKNVSRKLGNINMFYVKAFQSISSNSQLLSREQIEFLSSYTDNVPYGADDIDLDFRTAIAEVNKHCEDKLMIPHFSAPIKSGMIALIYEGYIGPKKVIIKVARKNIRQRLANALRQIDLLSCILAFFLHLESLNVKDIISENKEMMMLQTDFKNELHNIISMQEKYKNIDSIVVPKPYPEYTEAYKNIIVMEYLTGNTVRQIADKDRNVYSKQLSQFSLKGILYDRIIHADLHPGNILFLQDDSGKCQLGIIDYGVMLRITKQQQNDFFNFAYAFIIEKDSEKAFTIIANAFIEPILAGSDNDSGENIPKKKLFIQEIGNIIETSLKKNLTIQSSEIYLINKILYTHGYRLTKTFCKIEMALAIADSVCKQLNGENSYIDNIAETATKILTPDICAF
jgi:ubiquinone biosynthesis protein